MLLSGPFWYVDADVENGTTAFCFLELPQPIMISIVNAFLQNLTVY